MTLPNGPYKHQEHESTILNEWIENGYYKPEYNPYLDKVQSTEEMKADGREAWTLICPPPNAYGRPHVGNISGYAYMDAMARYQRMNGKKVLMIPGKDHAGLEGEGVFVREVLEKQKRFKFDMKREDFYAEMMEWMADNMQDALKDEKDIGLSADFERNTFTLDPDIVETVLDTFVEMYNSGMIYKGVRIINYDIKARTAVADNQIEYKDAETPFYYFKYLFTNSDSNRREWKLSFYDEDILGAIADGKKTVETRVLNPEEKEKYYGEIKEKDIIHCVNKNNGKIITKQVKAVRIYKDSNEFFKKEDLSNVFAHTDAPKDHNEMIEMYDGLAENYGKKLKNNGVVAMELEAFDGAPDPFVLQVKKDFENKEISWEYQEHLYGEDEDDILPYAYGEVDDKKYINPNDGDPLDVIGFGYGDLEVEKMVDGKIVGLIMQIDGNYNLIVLHPEYDESNLQKDLFEFFQFYSKIAPGAHPILFEENPDDSAYRNGFVIGTVRPETIFADTAIACDPSDERYAEFVGKEVEVEFLGETKTLNFISDFAVDKEFGTGLLKVTPAHAVEDWEIGQRHPEECLPAIQVINYDLTMNHLCGKYEGMRIKDAREAMKDDMREYGNIVFIDEYYKNRIQIAERTKAPIEPLLSSQWYLRYDGIKEAAIKMVFNAHGDDSNLSQTEEEIDRKIKEFESLIGEKEKVRAVTHPNPPSREGTPPLERGLGGVSEGIHLHPDSMVPKFNYWMDNLRDWAISRSLWWGYRLPVWYHGEIKEEIGEDGQVRELIRLSAPGDQPSAENPNTEHRTPNTSNWVEFEYDNPNHMRVQKESPGAEWHQDEGVLDTWFSSGQWPYATLQKYGLMEEFFPTDVLVSGFDILENWDSRMMMFSYFKTGQVPFKNLYLTGLVKGPDGQKMSKSKGNVLSTDELRERYGTDALRMVYFYQNSAGSDYVVSHEKMDTFKKFVNKIWNASKFVLMNLEDYQVSEGNNSSADEGEKEKEKNEKGTTSIGKQAGIQKDDLKVEEARALFDHVVETHAHITENIENFDFGLATYNLYQAFWHEFADVHIEETKTHVYTFKDKETGEIISEPDPEAKRETQMVLLFALKTYLKMLHPFMPFVTERLWKELPKGEGEHGSLMYSEWGI